MDIRIFHLIEGARQAEGLTVIIDVFRAFSMECYLYAAGAREVRPVGSVEETFAWKERDPGCILVGERHGRRIPGCDLGNSPSSVDPAMIRGKRVIHTTSAGTQGIVNAIRAEEILTGSFVNAKAVADYIRRKAPEKVSLVCMGKEGLEQAEEDELCAAYLKHLLTDGEIDLPAAENEQEAEKESLTRALIAVEEAKKEGIVIRPTEPVYCELISAALSMKVVSNKYLLKNEEG